MLLKLKYKQRFWRLILQQPSCAHGSVTFFPAFVEEETSSETGHGKLQDYDEFSTRRGGFFFQSQQVCIVVILYLIVLFLCWVSNWWSVRALGLAECDTRDTSRLPQVLR